MGLEGAREYIRIDEEGLLVLECEADNFIRKVPNSFIYLTEVPGRAIRSLVAPHGPSVLKVERERDAVHYLIHPPHSAVFIRKPGIITILVWDYYCISADASIWIKNNLAVWEKLLSTFKIHS